MTSCPQAVRIGHRRCQPCRQRPPGLEFVPKENERSASIFNMHQLLLSHCLPFGKGEDRRIPARHAIRAMSIQCKMRTSLARLLPRLAMSQRRCCDPPQALRGHLLLTTTKEQLIPQRSRLNNEVDRTRIAIWESRRCLLYEQSVRFVAAWV